jgi:hypothetical protein
MYPEKFNLSWNDFDKGASNTFKELLGETDFVDVTLVSDDLKQIKAHKVILSACSSIFRKMLQQNPQQQPIIYLTGVAYKEMESMIHFMYLGQTEVNQDDLNHFMEVAAKFDIKGLNQLKPPDEAIPVDHQEEKFISEKIEPNEEHFPIKKAGMDSLYYDKDDIRNEHENILTSDDLPKPNLVKATGNLFSCEQCDYKSKQIANVTAHKNARHEGIKFPCDQCEYRSSFSNNLKRHKRNHHKS